MLYRPKKLYHESFDLDGGESFPSPHKVTQGLVWVGNTPWEQSSRMINTLLRSSKTVRNFTMCWWVNILCILISDSSCISRQLLFVWPYFWANSSFRWPWWRHSDCFGDQFPGSSWRSPLNGWAGTPTDEFSFGVFADERRLLWSLNLFDYYLFLARYAFHYPLNYKKDQFREGRGDSPKKAQGKKKSRQWFMWLWYRVW